MSTGAERLRRFDNPPQFALNSHYYGGSVTPDPRDQAKGWLQAIDAGTGQVRWRQQWPTPLVAAVTATGGKVLFTGDLDNNFLAIDARDGKTLYSFNTGGSVGGGVITYELDGKQYVATASGVISGFFGGSGTSAVIFSRCHRFFGGSATAVLRHAREVADIRWLPIPSKGPQSRRRHRPNLGASMLLPFYA